MSDTTNADDTPLTDVHAHILLPSVAGEVERRAPDGVQEAAALELKRNGAESLAVSGPWSALASRSSPT